jgi:hypothetical protein
MVSQINPDLGRDWANEVFALSPHVNGGQRSQAQSKALRILIRLDPDRALSLLHQLSADDREAKSDTLPAQMELAQQVFGILATRDGEKALPVLEQEADRLGIQGHYPYAAVGYATMQVTDKYWGNDNARAIRILESVFQPAFARYNQAPRTYLDDYEFGRMLQVFAGGLPFGSVQPALRALVKNLLATDTDKFQFRAEVTGGGGQKAVGDNAIDAAILAFGSLVNRDPDLAKELESSRPELQKGLELLTEGQHGSIGFGPTLHSQPSQSTGQTQTYQDAVHLAPTNPAEAIAMAQELPDGMRTTALLQIARVVSRYDPGRAATVIARVKEDNKPLGEGTSLDIISTQAFVAAGRNDQSALRDALKRGFVAANHILSEKKETGGSDVFITDLFPLVHIGMEHDPDFTIGFVQGLPASRLKAELLLDAASALPSSSTLNVGTQL